MNMDIREILSKFGKEVGNPIDIYLCSVQNQTNSTQGHMILTDFCLCFHSNCARKTVIVKNDLLKLGEVERIIRVPFTHINITRKENSSMIIPNSIYIESQRKKYFFVFKDFHQRNDCFDILQSKCPNAITDVSRSLVLLASSSDSNSGMFP